MLKLLIMPIVNFLKKLNRRDTKLFPKFTKVSKIVFSFSILVLAVIVTTSIFAQTVNPPQITNPTTDLIKKQNALKDGNNQESWMNEAAGSNALVGINTLSGPIPEEVIKGQAYNWTPGGIIGFANNSIASLYNQPASGIEYLASIKDNFLGKPALAYSSGFTGLKPIFNLWKSFRDAIYIFFSIIFIGIGIAIMLRVKISQQAVITIQSAIPKLITSLILVTFSYAIAGLLIDLSYVFMGLVLAILYSSKGADLANLSLFNNPPINFKFAELVNMNFWTMWAVATRAVPMAMLAQLAGAAAAIIALISIPTLHFGAIAVGVVAFLIIIFIIEIIIAINIIKFFFGLIKCYINLILRIILAPLEIGMGAVPNSKVNFSSWILNVVANLAVFPISIIFLLLVNLIIEAVKGDLWAPLVIGSFTWILAPAIGLGSLMLLSKLPTLIPEAIFQIKPNAFGKAIGDSLKPYGAYASRGATAATRQGVNTAGGWLDKQSGNQKSGWRGATGKIGRMMKTFSEK